MISLDIDGVLADWVGAVLKEAHRQGRTDFPTAHAEVTTFDFVTWDTLRALIKAMDISWDEFLLHQVQPLITDIPFYFSCYITHRSEEHDQATMAWLERHGFPDRPVVHVADFACKADAIRSQGATIHVDDRALVYEQLSQTSDITPLLFDQPWNQGIQTPNRIYSLHEVALYA